MVKTINQHGQFTIQCLLDDLCPINSKRWTLDRQKLSFQTHVDISVKDTNNKQWFKERVITLLKSLTSEQTSDATSKELFERLSIDQKCSLLTNLCKDFFSKCLYANDQTSNQLYNSSEDDAVNLCLGDSNMRGVCRHHTAVFSTLVTQELGIPFRALSGHRVYNNLSISGAWHVMVEFELVSNGASIVLDPTG